MDFVSPALTNSPVLIIGTGLLGTSIGLRLRALGVEVHLQDTSPVAANLAQDLGAGTTAPVTDPSVVVVAVPPDVTIPVISQALDQYPHAIVTDVSSVKSKIACGLQSHPQASRWVGSHPMAGKERSGAIAADADLFIGRPWVVVPGEQSSAVAVGVIRDLAVDMGGALITMDAADHDRAVAVVSHVPQIMSSLVATSLLEEQTTSLELAGQGLRDVTRIAQSDPLLWTSIISENRVEISRVLKNISRDLYALISAIDSESGLDVISHVIADGNDGVARIPGKHGGAPTRYAEVIVLVPDKPAELGRLFSEVGEIGINIEDFSLEHSPQQPAGRAMLSVLPANAHELEVGLEQRGWQIINTSRKGAMPLVVAIDGPSGSGKSTVSRMFAKKMRLAYLDTGAMYRAATWWALHQGIDLDDQEAVYQATLSMPLEISLDPENPRFICAGHDVSAEIRTSELSKVVSKVATNLDVRANMKARQREIIAQAQKPDSFSHGRGIVAEGRDITTVVAPDAHVRVLLTASEEARLRRRALEVRGSDDATTLAATRDEVLRRDRDDSTVSEFMTAQDGVTTIDSSELTIEQVVNAIETLTTEVCRG
ncbi:prephenate dehydrogenase [Arcanobacterium pluranimalium]|uniref:prephenate dehydrogenase n=1 Tax=Arcanobacterium pluranimalium TaxID=108028 RepID=UPI00195814E4|nr:prephenate dehydrogenase [Arcanobacterium pluranimalium]